MGSLLGKNYKIITKNPYNHTPLNYNGILIKGNWKDSYYNLIIKKNIKAIFLNCSLGWSENDYNFIEDLPPTILELDILDDYIRNLKGLENQKKLVRLKLDAIVKSKIYFEQLPNLRELYIHAEQFINENLYLAVNLEELYLDSFKQHDEHSLDKLINLKKLTIGNSNITSLEFLKSLKKLEKLELYNCKKINDFRPVHYLTNLKKLDISGYNNIGDLSFLNNNINLEVLLINAGTVDSISFLKYLPNIKALAIYGNKSFIKDMDIKPINYLRKLSILDIPNRKEYNGKINNYWDWNDYDIPKDQWVENISGS